MGFKEDMKMLDFLIDEFVYKEMRKKDCLDDDNIKRYLKINDKEIINDFKTKPKKQRRVEAKPLAKRIKEEYIPPTYSSNKIEKVIINNPAVIILWDDGDKTMAMCEKGERFDAEKGFAIALAKKFVGNERFRSMLSKYVWEANLNE